MREHGPNADLTRGERRRHLKIWSLDYGMRDSIPGNTRRPRAALRIMGFHPPQKVLLVATVAVGTSAHRRRSRSPGLVIKIPHKALMHGE